MTPDEQTPETDEHVLRYGVTEAEARQADEEHAAKSPEQLAYEAGRDAADDPSARRAGADGCPFSALDNHEERTAWFRGVADALEEQAPIEALRAAAQQEAQNG